MKMGRLFITLDKSQPEWEISDLEAEVEYLMSRLGLKRTRPRYTWQRKAYVIWGRNSKAIPLLPERFEVIK